MARSRTVRSLYLQELGEIIGETRLLKNLAKDPEFAMVSPVALAEAIARLADLLQGLIDVGTALSLYAPEYFEKTKEDETEVW